MKISLKLIPILLASLLIVACGGGGVGNDGATVGGSCESDGDCETTCATDGDFPGGLCTQSCSSSDECPGGSVCIEKDDGLCVLECESDADCREGWVCDSEDLQGSEQKATVCIKD